MRYAIVTSSRRNFAGAFVRRAADAPIDGAELAAVILCANVRSRAERQRLLKRRARKALRIGVLGTVNGFRMRHWYGPELSERMGNPDIVDVTSRCSVPLIQIESFRDEAAREAFSGLALDVGVSMGNGYIPSGFFSIPRLGMINIHHEWLPDYKGAQTVLWQLHDGSSTSGYTIHEITTRIDGGRILHRERVPMILRPTLRETVVETSAEVQRRSIDGLRTVLGSFDTYREAALMNSGERSYTTPGGLALLRIVRNHRRLWRAHEQKEARAAAT